MRSRSWIKKDMSSNKESKEDMEREEIRNLWNEDINGYSRPDYYDQVFEDFSVDTP